MYRFERWKGLIQTARDVSQLQRVMREYVDSIMPSEMTRLPATVQAMLGRPDEDIQGAAVDLIRTELGFEGEPEAIELLHEIAHTYVAASNRLAQLQAR